MIGKPLRSRPSPLGARMPGVVRGAASLRFARRGGRTVLSHSSVAAPVALVRPFDLPGGRLAVQLVTLGPGLCAGDTIDIDVAVEDGAEVLLTTPAATRVMSMEPGQWVEQHVRLRAGRRASLEFYPALTIPFPASALSQTIAVEADATARIGVVEAWALGRAARSEYLEFRSLVSRATLTVDGVVTYADVLQLRPADGDLAGAGVLDRRRYVAAGFFYGVDVPANSAAVTRAGVEVAFGQSRPGLAYLRVLADDAPALEAAVQGAFDRIAQGWNQPPTSLDRFRC